MYEVLIKIHKAEGVRFERTLVRAANMKMAAKWAVEDLNLSHGERGEVLFVQPQGQAEKWNKSVGFQQLPVERMQALSHMLDPLTEQEARVLWGMLNMRLNAGKVA